MIDLPTDSGDYHLITKGVELSKTTPGMTMEIGLRRGGGTKVILDALKLHSPEKVHIAIDPYGHIEYEHKQDQPVRLDYTNQMRDECLLNLYAYTRQQNQPFLFFNLEDTEYFKRFADGMPIYNLEKRIETKYSFVHFDGPHSIGPLWAEIEFFLPRTAKGACWTFDDVTGYYNHDFIEDLLFKAKFTLIQKTWHKALYQFNA
jgi:hypothetical protein